ncbi:unnamed protein product [Paramecium sonneborni]|uniref:Uncharacterized protein n=1 Tax=Paramecium sonneborni TaxID=65129 RepID=A0A8S1RLF5_9CILI|nr:unnamed protein product [Paramecium sonneborni]
MMDRLDQYLEKISISLGIGQGFFSLLIYRLNVDYENKVNKKWFLLFISSSSLNSIIIFDDLVQTLDQKDSTTFKYKTLIKYDSLLQFALFYPFLREEWVQQMITLQNTTEFIKYLTQKEMKLQQDQYSFNNFFSRQHEEKHFWHHRFDNQNLKYFNYQAQGFSMLLFNYQVLFKFPQMKQNFLE